MSNQNQIINNFLEAKRHSLSHILAMAVLELYPNVQLGIGPTIENGFYYDFLFPDNISSEDLSKIEQKMKELIKQNIKFEKQEINYEKAKEIFIKFMSSKNSQPFKLELIEELKEKNEPISIYKSADFYDLCAGPHIKSTQEINHDCFKLTKIAGAYWRGNEKNKMLTRIYGLAFEDKNELQKYLEMLKQAEKRDHRKLGQELNLFIIDEEVGQGLPLWLPKGAIIYNIAKDFAFKTYLKQGYEPVITPHIASIKLWQHSGHTDFYKDSLYSSFGIEGEEYMLKPMNCPFHVRMYKSQKRSYRDLPIRWTEMGTVYRYERSGTLHGLTRVRGFTQDDAHIICTLEQLEDELKKAFDLTLYILDSFGFKTKDMEINLSVHDPKNKEGFIGSDKDWGKAENTLKKVIENAGYKDFVYDIGGAVFYGPKIDFKVSDAIGRPWQLSTIQFDFNLPTRFKMTYQGSDGLEHTPFMIHRALLGSLERFMGVLIEHYAGEFPLWLSPVQIVIIPVGSAHKEHSEQLAQEFKDLRVEIKVEVWDENETVGNKIRKSIQQKIPYMLVIGDKEMHSENLHIRKRGSDKVVEISKSEFMENVKKIIKNKSIEL